MNQLIVYYFSIIVVYYFLLLERCNNSSNGANIQILHSTTPNDILEALFYIVGTDRAKGCRRVDGDGVGDMRLSKTENDYLPG